MINNNKKTCSQCKLEKTLDNFYIDRRSSDGLYGSCKKCFNIARVNKRKITPNINKTPGILSDNHKENLRRSAKKRRSSPVGKLNHTMSNYIQKSLRGTKRGKHWEDLVGWKKNELKSHLEKLFLLGMNWNNYGEWEVDHIIPIVVFNFQSPKDIDFKKCWALSNLQPLWKIDNARKNGKLSSPFQPSLLLEF